MREVAIKEIRVDESGRLLVVPTLQLHEDLSFIYRAEMEVSWSQAAHGLLSPELRPGGWSYADWFHQIVRAAIDEYGTKLVVDAQTVWSVPGDVRSQIEGHGARA